MSKERLTRQREQNKKYVNQNKTLFPQHKHTKTKSKQVEKFLYFETAFEYTGGHDEEINEKTVKVGQIFNGLKTTLFAKKEIPTTIEIAVDRKIVTPTVVYGSESLVLTARNKSQVNK